MKPPKKASGKVIDPGRLHEAWKYLEAITKRTPVKVADLLARAAEAPPEVVRLSPEKAKAVLDERARALARVPPAAAEASQILEIATFALANENYGVETRYVREVVRLSDYTPLPGAPAFLVGVLNLRGEILALIDLRTFFGVPARPHRPGPRPRPGRRPRRIRRAGRRGA